MAGYYGYGSALVRHWFLATITWRFCSRANDDPESIGLFNVKRDTEGTRILRFEESGLLFNDSDIGSALQTTAEDGVFESLMLRGLLDE